MYIKVVLSIFSFINIHISFYNFLLLNELITFHVIYFFDYSDLDLRCVWGFRMNFKNYAQIICFLKLLTIYHDNL